MKPALLYETLLTDFSPAQRVGYNPYYQKMARESPGRLSLGGQRLFDLASNDYLGLAADPRIKNAMSEAVQCWGASFCGTPIAAGYAATLAELESAAASLLDLEDAVIFPSCFQANSSLFGAIAGERDVIIVDHYAHASLIQGIKTSGARIRPFLHNDLNHLERQLSASAGKRRRFVVTESVFSTEGSIAPFDGVIELCERFGATPVIDDSHGIGVIGAGGRGVLEYFGIAEFNGIYTASLGKALANTGGIIAGKRALIDFLRFNCPGLIYSTALVPSSAAGALAAIDIVNKEFSTIGAEMWRNHETFVSQLTAASFRLAPARAPIASIQCGSTDATLALAKAFFAQGILATPFIPPSVPPDQGVLRLIIGAKLDVNVLAEIGNRIKQVAAEFQG